MTTISLVILTQFKKPISKLIDFGLSYFDEILLVINNYKENNRSKYKDKRIRVIGHQIQDNFAKIRNLAHHQSRSDYLFFIDDDEDVVIDDETAFEGFLKKLDKEVYQVKRYEKFLGSVLKHSESIFHARFVKRQLIWQGRVHERVKSGQVGKVQGLFLVHDQSSNILEFVNKLNYYSNLRVRDLKDQKLTGYLWQLFVYPKAKFGQNYILRGGFLDGWPGLFQAFLMAYYSLIVRVKLYLIRIQDN